MSKKNIQPSQKHFSKKLIQLKCSLDTKTKSKKKKIRITLKSVIANMVTYWYWCKTWNVSETDCFGEKR